MTSLRQTRRFSAVKVASPELEHRDSYYDSPPHSDLQESLNTSNGASRSNPRKEGRTKRVRRAKSNIAVRSSELDDEYAWSLSPRVPRVPLPSGQKSGPASGKKAGRQRRSQSARPRNESDLNTGNVSLLLDSDYTGDASDRAGKQSSHNVQGSKFLLPRPRSQSDSRSPSLMPSSSDALTVPSDINSISRGHSKDSHGYKLRTELRESQLTQAAATNSLLCPDTPTRQQSKLPASMSRAASPAPMATPIFRPHGNTATGTPLTKPSPLSFTRASGVSRLPVDHHNGTTIIEPDAIPGPPFRPRPPSQSSQIITPTLGPRTLKDVTRRLGQSRENQFCDSEPRHDGLPKELPFSYIPIPFRSQSARNETGAPISLSKMNIKVPERLHVNSHLTAVSKPKYGLAIKSENGYVLGERSDIELQLFSKKGMETSVPFRPGAAISSGLSRSNGCTPSLKKKQEARSESDAFGDNCSLRQLEREKITANNTLMKAQCLSHKNEQSSSSRKQSRPKQSPMQGQVAASTNQTLSSPSLFPRHSNKALGRKQPASSRSDIPHSSQSHPEHSAAHRPTGSDSSARSFPRQCQLVICNPDANERPSSSSSSNHETPISLADDGSQSQDFSILALSASQTSLANSGSNYIVPDEVAAELATHEERRRKALVGLVNGLNLDKHDQQSQLLENSASQRHSPHTIFETPKKYSVQESAQDLDEDDDTFFSRLSMHGEDFSLLEEPEPQAVFRDDNDDDADEDFDSQDEIYTEDDEQEEGEGGTYKDVEPPLPPTPNFVHPITDGDDLESRITRVASLHRISTTPLSSESHYRDENRRVYDHTGNEWAPCLLPDLPNRHTIRGPSREGFNRTECITFTGSSESSNIPKVLQVEDRELSRKVPFPITARRVDSISSQKSMGSIMATDNELSSVSGGRLSETGLEIAGALSCGAEALFKKLQVEADARDSPRTEQGEDDSISDSYLERGAQTFLEGKTSSHDFLSNPITSDSLMIRTWRSTLPLGAYDSLAERHGPSEMRRQEIIWELCETELTFVKSLRLILRLFVQPLRHEDKTWITGVPRDVTRLFDWFDDIMHLHSQISSALHATRATQYPVVIQVAETLRPFVPRLELHQPYLVRLESVTSAVEGMSRDLLSDFGEFVRIQTASPECESMNLPSFLLKPVQRLMKYPLFFKQLWELTPRNHPDHLATFSLLHSTDMIIRVMQEVKAREEEYELVKNLASRIKGIPSSFQLARRERRLVAQGLLHRIILSDKERHALDSASDVSKAGSSQDTSLSRKTSISSNSSSFTGDWTYHPARGTGKQIPSEQEFGLLRADSTSSDKSQDSWPHDSPRQDCRPGVSRIATPNRSRSSSLRGSIRHRVKESSVYAFVFTDLVVLTTPVPERHHLLRSPKSATEPKETWKLLEDIGVSRVLGVADHTGQLTSHDHLITLELMPMTPKALQTGLLADGAPSTPVHLTIPEEKLSSADGAFEALTQARAKWLDAFEHCFRFTLRSLSFPSYTAGNSTTSGGTPDLELDTKNSVMSILASGLPLPMSPSQQLSEAKKGRPTDLVQGEREERGWWSLRFQQVLKEMERSSGSPVLNAGLGRARDKRQGGKRSETRPLLLSSNPLSAGTRKGILSLGKKKK
ncbi:hypothetical protein K439DRAFT_1203085 [Ramaria rubella]|nr:hypothetical protein K439DRAFT_1203085 [Ramaria rubella]